MDSEKRCLKFHLKNLLKGRHVSFGNMKYMCCLNVYCNAMRCYVHKNCKTYCKFTCCKYKTP